MPNAPDRLMAYLNEKGYYHPRAIEHSDRFSLYILDDLLGAGGSLRHDLGEGGLAYDLNVTVSTPTTSHDIDLVLGEPRESPIAKGEARRAPLDPGKFRVVVEHKSVVTAHRNRLNRLRDMRELPAHVSESSPRAIIGGTTIIGTALKYLSVEVADRVLRVLREEDKIPYWRAKMCKDDPALVTKFEGTAAITSNSIQDAKQTFDMFLRGIPLRTDVSSYGFDAYCLVPVHIDNISECRIDGEAFPNRTDPFTYDNFLQSIIRQYESCFH